MNGFFNIKDLITALNREKDLLAEMFAKRISFNFKYTDALSLVDEDENRLEFLVQMEVLRKNEQYLELEDQYLEFFEQVLAVNEEINPAYIDQSILQIKENIDYFLNETNPKRKYSYLKIIKKVFRRVGVITLRNVIDLRRNVDNTFKNEQNYKNKILKLNNLDEKSKLIKKLIDQTLNLTDTEERTFYNQALDSELRQIITNLKFTLRECAHNLIEIQAQIIEYLNQIELQGQFLEKLQKIKYLKDQLVLTSESNIHQILNQRNPVIFEKRVNEPLKLSLDELRNSEVAFEVIKRVAERFRNRMKIEIPVAGEIADDFLENNEEEQVMIDFEAVKNQFLAGSNDLFNFILNHDFHIPVSFDQRITIFCQMASQYELNMEITDDFAREENVEYALIYPK